MSFWHSAACVPRAPSNSSSDSLMTPDTGAFDTIIIQQLPNDSQGPFVRHLWAPDCTSESAASVPYDDGRDIDYKPYFEFYLDQCALALREGGKHVSVRTHRDVLEVAEHLKVPGRTREEIARKLSPSFGLVSEDGISETSSCIAPHSCASDEKPFDDDTISNSIHLAARLLTMTNYTETVKTHSRKGRLVWKQGSLADCIAQYFENAPQLTMKAVQLEKVFNARNLRRFTGMEIEWTDNLADHLCMCEYDKKIRIFHHATFLQNHKHALLPQALVDETLKTLALLFPSSDPKTQAWYERVQKTHNLDPQAAKVGALRSEDRIIDNFYYWKDRIVILKQEFDEAEPKTFRQWWSDRRKGPQWYTFWIAMAVLLLTIFFGFLQSVEGALQVYKAFHPAPAPSS